MLTRVCICLWVVALVWYRSVINVAKLLRSNPPPPRGPTLSELASVSGRGGGGIPQKGWPCRTFFEIRFKIKWPQKECLFRDFDQNKVLSTSFSPQNVRTLPIMLRWLSLTVSWPLTECATIQGPRRQRLKGPQRQEEWLALRGQGLRGQLSRVIPKSQINY